MIDFDPAKDLANVAKHRISLARAVDLDLRFVGPDDRKNYGEARMIGYGLLDGRPAALVFTIRDGVVRAISLRRCHLKEYRRYVPALSRSRRATRSRTKSSSYRIPSSMIPTTPSSRTRTSPA